VATANDTPTPSPLTSEQWAGLARLGDLVQGLEFLMRSPASTVPVDLARKAGDWNERLALDETLLNVAETLQSLRQAGVLHLLRENAGFVVESIRLLAPLLPKLLETMKALPTQDLLRAARTLLEILSKVQALTDFLQGAAGKDLVAALRRMGDLWEETRADESLIALLQLLRRLQEDGNLQRLGDLSEQIGLLTETVDLPSLLGSLVQENRNNPLLESVGAAIHLSKALAQALAESSEHAAKGDHQGGLRGLYRTLKDPEVQRGLRVAATLPVYVEKTGVLKGPPNSTK
jgi:uncharacterized protein YjgD (DUF1641 family)